MTDWRKRLQQLDHPIYVSIIGAGAMGKGLAWQGYVQTRRTLAMWTVRNVVAVTGACLVVSRAAFEAVGGFDERLPVAFNDVELCLKLHAAGYWNVWTPFAELTHHHWATRGRDNTAENEARKMREAAYLREKWEATIPCDPFCSESYHA
jgi:GT2 family glycosyltransferase